MAVVAFKLNSDFSMDVYSMPFVSNSKVVVN